MQSRARARLWLLLARRSVCLVPEATHRETRAATQLPLSAPLQASLGISTETRQDASCRRRSGIVVVFFFFFFFSSRFLFVRSQCAALCDGSKISKMRQMESRGSIAYTSAHAQPSSTSSACSPADSRLQHESPFHAASSIFAASIFAAGPRLGRWASATGEEVEVLLFDVVDFASRRCFGASVTRSRAGFVLALS